MKRYAMIFGLLVVLMLVVFGLVEALEVPLLVDPVPTMTNGAWWTALVGVGLLLVDVVLPVPSSLVMIAHGTLFGVVLGTGLSLMGGLGAAGVGFLIGRRSRTWLQRLVSLEEQQRANRFLAEWGWLAILVTRPIPVLAETTIIMAGAAAVSWQQMWSAAFLGLVPSAVLYAFTGAYAAQLDSALLAFGIVVALAALMWCIRYFIRDKRIENEHHA